MRRLYFYLHTHWDREWYLPFESFRVHLVACLKKVLSGLEEGTLPNFYLDGQSALLQDALAIAPELEANVKKELEAGRLASGPWYVLADQMLVTGESLVRNLQYGLRLGSKFGPTTKIGYCPDTFGHSQDLPRILAGFGMKYAVVWRGVPHLPSLPLFSWESPDGSSVLAYHLNRGYYQSLFFENLPLEKIARELLGFLQANGAQSTYCRQAKAALMPVGGDHFLPAQNLGCLLKQLTPRLMHLLGEPVELEIIGLSEYLQLAESGIAGSAQELSRHKGELRDNSCSQAFERAYMLFGVLSTRLYLKRENRLAEHKILKVCEPFFAFLSLLKIMDYPKQELEHAWRLLLQNHPHDSICGCSIDQVHRQMLVRFQETNDILDALLARGQDLLCQKFLPAPIPENPALSFSDPGFKPNSLLIFNSSASPASGLARIKVYGETGDAPPACLQVISQEKREELFFASGFAPYYKEVNIYEGYIQARDIPPLGFKKLEWPKDDASPALTIAEGKLANELVSVTVDAQGRLRLCNLQTQEELTLLHKFKSVSDAGDTYSFDPLPDDKPRYSRLLAVKPGKAGPLLASLYLTYEIEIPASVIVEETAKPAEIGHAEASATLIRHEITTELSLHSGSPIIFFETTWENQAKDHRLEVVFGTEQEIKHSWAENHFSLIERNHEKEKPALPCAPGAEAPGDRFPCQRFFASGGLAFFNTGLPEYGAEGNDVSITILRAVSMLSRGRLRSRGGGAGPHLKLAEANCPGKNVVNYGLALLGSQVSKSRNEIACRLYELAEEYEGSLKAVLIKSDAGPLSFSFLNLNNPSLKVSAIYARENPHLLYLRLLNISDQVQEMKLEPGVFVGEIMLCNLNDEPVRALENNVVSLKPFELVGLSFKL